jgi:maleylacetoacetate isomerase
MATVLYDYWRSSASYRVRLALNLKGVAYEAVAVDLLTGGHRSPEHLARNPQGLVPALAVDGAMLTQSLAILDYLEETRPSPPLLPAGPLRRARVRAAAQAIAVDIHPICNLSVAKHVAEITGGGAAGQEAARKAWMQRYIGRGLQAVEPMARAIHEGGSFLDGDSPGLFECCLVPQLYNARRWEVDLVGLDTLLAIDAACATLPAFQRATPEAVRS